MQRKNAFSLAEILIAISVVGILYLILVPIMTNNSPKTDKVMFRKAYNTIEKTIYNMINDDSLYPDVELGFASNPSNFCKNYFEYLNTTSYTSGSCSAKTTDGISWDISDVQFSDAMGPLNDYKTTIKATVKGGNSFSVKVRYDGKIKITDSKLIDILENPLKNN